MHRTRMQGFLFLGNMARYKKKDYLTTIELLGKINRKLQESGWNQPDVAATLVDCQEAAIALGTNLEQQGEIGVQLTHILEEYCENLYQLGEQLDGGNQENCVQIAEKIDSQLVKFEEKLEKKLEDKKEVVFLPYKASMWDSLESIWMAAEADPACDAYVVPIPYYERNADGSFGGFHYEEKLYPAYVPVTHYQEYDLKERHPDVIFIHNPYDQYNSVTSIDPEYYSDRLKMYTECLVYIPYYASAGGTGIGQSLCPVYLNADYIVMQSENYRKCYDARIPDRKFLPLGSPKFDKVIRLCANPPEAPDNWKEKMEGKKVYFYNTSLFGMLADTECFLRKMRYVFQCFEGRDDCCLVWRPHPLLEATFTSMRKEFQSYFDELKQWFFQSELGIYDDTPDLEQTLALCDAYIGDSSSSVILLFGVAGKPIFILNNRINTLPQKEDWRGETIREYYEGDTDKWMITRGNQLYYSPKNDYKYEFYCDLSPYSGGYYYGRVIEFFGKIYVCPANAQNILVLDNKQIIKKVSLRHEANRGGVCCTALYVDGYIYLIPLYYPAIVRYDTQKDQIDYIEEYQKIISKNVNGEWRVGGSCVWENYIMIASPNTNEVLVIESASMKVSVVDIRTGNTGGCMVMVPEGEEIWLLPYEGTVITRWNPLTGFTREYGYIPEKFECLNRNFGYKCMERPFSGIAFGEDFVIVSPYWGNMFLMIDRESGKVQEWVPPFPISYEDKNGYWHSVYVGKFLRKTNSLGAGTVRYYDYVGRKLFDVNINTNEYRDISILFSESELRKHESGFSENSEWLPYACMENVFCTLDDFLDGKLCGNGFDKDKQIAAHKKITENMDGTCGKEIYHTVCQKLGKGER